MDARLYMEFKDSIDKKVTLTVDDPRTDLDGPQLMEAMNSIIVANVIDSKGNSLSQIDKAYIVTKNKQTLI